MNSSDRFAGKTDDELRGQAKTSITLLAVLGVIDTLYGVFLLYSAASGNWSWRMGLAVVPLLCMLAAMIIPMNQLSGIQQELSRRNARR